MKKVKTKNYFWGGIISAAGDIVSKTAGTIIGLNEKKKAERDIKRLQDEQITPTVPSELYEGLNAIEAADQYQKEASDRASSTTAAAWLRDPRSGQAMSDQNDRFMQNARENSFMTEMRKQARLDKIASSKREVQKEKMDVWNREMAMANERRAAGINTAFNQGSSIFSSAGSLTDEIMSMNAAKGARIGGEYKGLKGEKAKPNVLVDAKTGKPRMTKENEVIVIGDGEFIINEPDMKNIKKGLEGSSKHAKMAIKTLKSKRFK